MPNINLLQDIYLFKNFDNDQLAKINSIAEEKNFQAGMRRKL